MYEFDYNKADSLAHAVELLKGASDGKLLAGGMTLLPTLKQRLARPTHLIDLANIPELRGISRSGNSLTIRAMTRHVDVARSADVAGAIPALAELAGSIGDPAVRNRGTIGGSISNNDPAADYPAAVLALNATVVTNTRKLSADQFFTGMFETALEPAEIVTAVEFRISEVAAYIKFRSQASGYALVGVFVARHKEGVRVAVTGAAPMVFRQVEMEAALQKSFAPSAIKDIVQDSSVLNSDMHAGAEYRAHLVSIMTRRAVEAASMRDKTPGRA